MLLVSEVKKELEEDILPFWIKNTPDEKNGGFIGRISGCNDKYPDAPKGAVLNVRILWAFSAAYRLLRNEEYLKMAERAKVYIINNFYDKKFGGVYWSLTAGGEPLDDKKQIYALGFAIYGLSEFYRATGDEESLEYACRLFRSVEKYSFDPVKNGYLEACKRDWSPIADLRLSEKDENEKKTMNTHLHILEAYTNLYRVWKDDSLKKRLYNLIDIFLTKILDRTTGHMNLFFDEDWNSRYDIISYGHEIEASWLLYEAAAVLGDKDMMERAREAVPLIVRAAGEGLQSDGSMMYETRIKKLDIKNKKNPAVSYICKTADLSRQWWVEAETVLGYLSYYINFGDENALDKAMLCWKYIKYNLIDTKNGEWFWAVDDKGCPDVANDKTGFWKCPYHNSRMCLNVMEWLESEN
jgi:mannobiose 2-epimerase